MMRSRWIRAWVAALFVIAGACTGSPVNHERWTIKTSIPAGIDLSSATPTTVALADLLDHSKLPNPPGAKPKNPAYNAARYPAFSNPLGVNEGALVTTSGWLHLVAGETDDGDYHIQISVSQTDGNNCLIVETPDPDSGSIMSPDLKDRFRAARAFLKAKLPGSRDPANAGTVLPSAVYVKVTGILFFDDAHVKKDGGMQNRGKKGMKAGTLWELHPVVEVVDAAP